MSQDKFIYCEKCGSRMKFDQRCCIKCGHINFLNKSNNSMEKYARKAEKEDSDSLLSNNKFISIDNSSNLFVADHSGSRVICLIFNLILYLISLCFLYSYRTDIMSFNLKINDNCKLVLAFLMTTYLCTLLLSIQIFYMKANKKWFSIFIPFYNLYKWFEITMNNGLYFLLLFVPVVNLILVIISFYNVGVKFKVSKFASMFFLPIVIVYLGLNNEVLYRDVKYVFGKNREKALSREFKTNRFIIRYLCFVTLGGACILTYYYYINHVMFIV